MLFFEWSNFEIGIIGAGILDKYSLSVMSITIQTIYMAFMVHLANFYFVRLKPKLKILFNF